MTTENTRPNQEWSIEQLRDFVQTSVRRNTVEAWWIGKALKLAEKKLKDEGNFNDWVESEVGISLPTAWRYREMTEHFTLEEVSEMPLKEVYRRLDEIRRARRGDLRVEVAATIPVQRVGDVIVAEKHEQPEEPDEAEHEERAPEPTNRSEPAVTSEESDPDPSDRPSWAVYDEEETDLERHLEQFGQSLSNFLGDEDVAAQLDEERRVNVATKLQELRTLIEDAIEALGSATTLKVLA